MVCCSYLIVLAAMLLAAIAEKAKASGWNYEEDGDIGPTHWPELFPTCAGQFQSPIDIDTSLVAEFYPEAFTFCGPAPGPLTLAIRSGGLSVQAFSTSSKVSMSGGGLPGTYTLGHFHFHWGKSCQTGSEHTVDSKHYPMEIHFVHYNSDLYPNVASAVASNDSSGLAVLAVFVDVNSEVNSQLLSNIAEGLQYISYKDAITTLNVVGSVLDLYPDPTKFYRYQGSVTMPTCNEVVVWTVFADPIYIAPEQLEKFRLLHAFKYGAEEDVLIEQNSRPVQDPAGRGIYRTPGFYGSPDPLPCAA